MKTSMGMSDQNGESVLTMRHYTAFRTSLNPFGRNHGGNHGETDPMSRTYSILTCPNCFGLNSGGNFGERNLNSLTYAILACPNEFGINSVDNSVGEQQGPSARIRGSGLEKGLQPDWHRRRTCV